MADLSPAISDIQEMIRTVESDQIESSGGNYLSESLDTAVKSLKDNFGITNPLLIATTGQSDQYAKMFTDIAEDFSDLFKELKLMRSSYLAFELAQNVPEASADPNAPANADKTLEEIVDAESSLESYENAFFRMLGMPSTSDIPEEYPLKTIVSDVCAFDPVYTTLNPSKFDMVLV